MGKSFWKGLRGSLEKKTESSFRTRGPRSGNIVLILVLGSAAIALLVGVGQHVSKSRVVRQAVVSENRVALINDMLLARVGQAVALNAFLCSEHLKKCFWNSTATYLKEKQFRIRDREELANGILKIKMESCLPGEQLESIFTDCQSVESEVELSLVDLQNLKNQQLVSGQQNLGDQDPYGILAVVKTPYMNFQNQKTFLTTQSVIRRPRPFVRIDATAGACAPTCYVSSKGRSQTEPLVAQHFCLGPLKVVNEAEATKARVSATVFNDGPGFLYAYEIKRQYFPDPKFHGGGSQQPPAASQFRSLSDPRINGTSKFGLNPGESIEIIDDQIRCADEKIHQTVVNTVVRHVRGWGGSWVTSVARATRQVASSSRPSGTSVYDFQSIVPRNAMKLTGDDVAVPATATITTTTINRVVVINLGMN